MHRRVAATRYNGARCGGRFSRFCCSPFLTFGIGLGRQAITEADEAYYAEAAREMVASGDWLTPHFNYEDRWQKPVLYYWLTAAAYRRDGHGRGRGALLVRALRRRARAARRGPRRARRRRRARTPGSPAPSPRPVTATSRWRGPRCRICRSPSASRSTIGAVFAAFDARGRDAHPAGGCWPELATGLGCLMKGPVAVAVPAIAWCPRGGSSAAMLEVRWSHVAVAAALAAVVALPWYVGDGRAPRHGLRRRAFSSVTTSNASRPRGSTTRGRSGSTSRSSPAACCRGRRSAWRARRPASPAWRAAVDAVARRRPTAVVGDGAHALLHGVGGPAAALRAAGAAAARAAHRARHRRAHRRGARRPADAPRRCAPARGLTVGDCSCCAAALLYRLQPLLVETSPLVLATSAVGLAAGGAALAVVALRGAWRALPLAATPPRPRRCSSACSSACSRPGGPPPSSAWPPSSPRTAPAANHWASLHAFTRNLVFYTGRSRSTSSTRRRGAVPRLSASRVLLVLPERDLADLAAAAHVEPPRVLARVRHLNTANLRLRSVLNPDPAIELETVVLVTNR